MIIGHSKLLTCWLLKTLTWMATLSWSLCNSDIIFLFDKQKPYLFLIKILIWLQCVPGASQLQLRIMTVFVFPLAEKMLFFIVCIFSVYLSILYLESFFDAVSRNSLYTVSRVCHPQSSFANMYMSTKTMLHLHSFSRSSKSLKCNLLIFTFQCTSLHSCLSSSVPSTSARSPPPRSDIPSLPIMYIHPLYCDANISGMDFDLGWPSSGKLKS